jgi:hypothetical protein
MKKILTILATVLSVTATDAIPSNVGNLLTLIELRVQQPSPGFRIQILRIHPNATIDPPPQLSSFDGWATFSLTFKPGERKKEILEAISTARKSQWEKLQYSGYARWCVRLIGPWNEIYDSIGIDEENLSAVVGGEWFKVDKETVQALTTKLVRAAVKEPAPNATNARPEAK